MSDFVEELLKRKKTPEMMKGVKEYAKQHFVPIMREECAAVLSQIAELKSPKKILEIGTAIGYSGTLMLSVAKDAVLYTIEYNESRAKEAKQNFATAGVGERANVFIGDVYEILPYISGSFDFVFMDGPKGHYEGFLDTVKEYLVDGAVIVCDNVLFRGYLENPENCPHRMKTITHNMTKFLERLVTDPEFDTSILDIADGMSVSIFRKGNKNEKD